MIKNIGKKLAASVCAVVSAIGTSEAAVAVSSYWFPILVHSTKRIKVKDNVKNAVNKISSLPCDFVDDPNYLRCKCVACAKDNDYGNEFGCILGVVSRTVHGVKYLNFQIYVNKCKGANDDGENYALAMSFDVCLEYIVERLGLKEADVKGVNLDDFLKSGDGSEKSIRFRLTKLVLEDVLGIKTDEGFYLEATVEKPSKSTKYVPNSVMSKSSHPDFNGCFWRYLKRELYDKNMDVLVGQVRENGDAGNYVGVDQKGVWELFFGTPEEPKETNYYKTMTNVPLSGGAKAAIAIPTTLAIVEATYIGVKQGFIDPMNSVVVDNYVLSLKNQVDELTPMAKAAELYEQLCRNSRWGKGVIEKVDRAISSRDQAMNGQNRAMNGQNRAQSASRGHRNSGSRRSLGIRRGGNKRSRSR